MTDVALHLMWPRRIGDDGDIVHKVPPQIWADPVWRKVERNNWLFLLFRKLGKKKQRFKLWRKKFLTGLQTVGLDIEDVSTDNFSAMVLSIDKENALKILFLYVEWSMNFTLCHDGGVIRKFVLYHCIWNRKMYYENFLFISSRNMPFFICPFHERSVCQSFCNWRFSYFWYRQNIVVVKYFSRIFKIFGYL